MSNKYYKNCFGFNGDRLHPACIPLKKLDCKNCAFYKPRNEIKEPESNRKK